MFQGRTRQPPWILLLPAVRFGQAGYHIGAQPTSALKNKLQRKLDDAIAVHRA